MIQLTGITAYAINGAKGFLKKRQFKFIKPMFNSQKEIEAFRIDLKNSFQEQLPENEIAIVNLNTKQK